MRYHTAFPEGKKLAVFWLNQDYTLGEFPNELRLSKKAVWLLTDIQFRPVFYATFGLILEQ
jgi:hypothetical protein